MNYCVDDRHDSNGSNVKSLSQSATTTTSTTINSTAATNWFMLTMSVIVGILIGLLVVTTLNQKCSEGSMNELERYAEALEKRLYDTELYVHKNNLLVANMIKDIQSIPVIKFNETELEDIMSSSQTKAVEIALLLSVKPPLPIDKSSSSYSSEGELNTWEANWGEGNGEINESGFIVDDKIPTDDHTLEETGKDDNFLLKDTTVKLSDTEASAKCNEMKEKYNVQVGVSWGTLPSNLQKEWLSMSCDYFELQV